jgi:hypothetical protein
VEWEISALEASYPFMEEDMLFRDKGCLGHRPRRVRHAVFG